MTSNINLKEWGLNDFINNSIDKSDEEFIGRVITEGNKIYKIITKNGVVNGEFKGKLVYEAINRDEFPAVGDWVIIDRNADTGGNAIINKIIPRKSKISRKTAGKRMDEQIIATNIDYIFICMSLNSDFNIRRLERYLTIVWDSMAKPVILLTKSDLCDDLDEKIFKVEEAAPGVDIIVSSSISGEGVEKVKEYLKEGITCTFIGSSGVGKSSVINYLKGEDVMYVNGLRNDDKGRHTTTHREAVTIPGGGVIIDTPGMREIQIMDVDESLGKTFHDIEEIIKKCKFSDCKHSNEPGCHVKETLENGELDEQRWKSYLKLKNEIEYFKRKNDKKAQNEYLMVFKKREKQRRNEDKILKNKKK